MKYNKRIYYVKSNCLALIRIDELLFCRIFLRTRGEKDESSIVCTVLYIDYIAIYVY